MCWVGVICHEYIHVLLTVHGSSYCVTLYITNVNGIRMAAINTDISECVKGPIHNRLSLVLSCVACILIHVHVAS